jgi:HlyD family secretion protein
MRSRLIAPRQDVSLRIVARAFTLALGGLLPLQAQEPGPPANGPGPTGNHAPGQRPTADLLSRLRAQHLTTRKASVAYELARSIRELVEIAEQEYVELNFPRELASIEEEIRLAGSDLALAKDGLERARRLDRFLPEPRVSEELTFKKAEFTLEQAQSKRKVLVDYIRPKTIKAFESVLEKARAIELARKQARKQEKAKEAELVRQLDVI